MRTIIINNKIIEYEVKYNAKKNVNIRVNPDLTLKVSAPKRILKGEVERILNTKSEWILNNIENQKVLARNKKVNTFENGHSVWLRGQKYRLYYRQSDRNFVYILEDQIFVLTKNSDDIEYSKKVLKKWLKSYAERECMLALEKYRNKMLRKYNIPQFTLQIRNMKTRWGTCIPSKRKITLNLSLLYAPPKCLEYVALHELSHFIEIYHNNHFYSILEEFMPDYKEWLTLLNKEYGQINKEN